MAVSKFSSASAANDFNVNIGSTYSVVNFTQEYPAGAYSFTSAQLDTTMDVYVYNALGTLVGYTNSKGLIASGGFNKMIIIGGTVNDVLSFSYKTTFNSVAETSEVTAGPVILSVTPTSLPNVNSSTTVTGLNFATDIAATFTGTDNLVRNAKSVVRGSATSLVVTRPDSMPTTYSPYTLTVTNPSVAYQPTGSTANVYSITAGVNPVWVTSAGALASGAYGSAYSNTISATDADGGSSIIYSVISGSLPIGGSINSSTGTITVPSLTNSVSFTIRATDSGGNIADRSFSISLTAPTVTSATLLWWYDLADTGSYTTSNGNVTTITDKSGNGRNATAAVSVPLASAQINGLNTVYFNQSGYFTLTNPVTFSSKTAHMFTVFQLPSSGARATDNCFIGTTASGNGLAYGAPANGSFQNYLNDAIAWGSISGQSTISNGVSYQINGSILNGTTAFRKNRVDDGSGSLSGTISASTNAFGNQEASYKSTAYVGEVLVYNTPLSTSDRNLIENYLNAKWGV
jgi:hypothetical protein